MEPFHAVVLTVSLFVLTFFNPGANLFVVVQTSLASGRRAGVITGLGVATGDAFYSGLAFRSGDAHYAMRSGIFSYQNCRRRLFIMVRLEQYSPPGDAANEHAPDADCRPVDDFLSPGINDRFIQSANRTVFY